MSETSELLREVAKNTRNGNGCCYNKLAQTVITFGGTDSYTFAKGTVHAIAWIVVSGSLTITIDGGTAVEYTSSEAMQFSTVNANEIVFTMLSGSANIQWLYK